MKILVLGGAGFIGYHLVEDLVAAGHDVVVMGRSDVASRPLPADVHYVSGELADSRLMRELLSGVDAVVHLVSGTVPSTGDKDPGRDVEVNLLGTLSLLEDMAACNVTRILYLSSGGTVYGKPQEVPIPEGHILDPICSYGVVKVAIESYLKLYEMKAGLQPIVIRASNPYGPYQGNLGVQGIIGTYLNLALKHQPIEIWGDGSTIRDYIHVKDLASLCVAALQSDKIGIYNGGSGTGTSVLHIAEVVQEITGNPIPIIYKPHRSLDVPVSVLDVERAKMDFDWNPKIGLREGIAGVWSWLKESQVKS
ncbi:MULTISPECIES: NAD-dependent epimerase/dehydratase family protein [Agrobacterium]|uniref:NAD-dependent epimerase/dehydratase family protein n=1 Tax=Agrobacterium TaxID=357 RepID=UPI000DD0017C|nr:NAD-dependent epimerase/dehydratase family protein [Agrobacterium sp. SORGH_AS_0745]MDP9562452.1 UDP-glucose 4-epimerase [Rhizobium nepotum]MDP9757463.1 UDP-glucose 4-epimerase [Agrobacterium tumefaciens]MDQ1218696.1 UDP-glucose 4-epimerase [Agrobacterium sp. SORGH_AS_0745]